MIRKPAKQGFKSRKPYRDLASVVTPKSWKAVLLILIENQSPARLVNTKVLDAPQSFSIIRSGVKVEDSHFSHIPS